MSNISYNVQHFLSKYVKLNYMYDNQTVGQTNHQTNERTDGCMNKPKDNQMHEIVEKCTYWTKM